jgi:hypothetical protein
MAKLTKEQRIIRHLEDYGTINCIEAFGYYQIYGLSSYIQRLATKGYSFNKKNITVVNRYGEKHKIIQYSFAKG